MRYRFPANWPTLWAAHVKHPEGYTYTVLFKDRAGVNLAAVDPYEKTDKRKRTTMYNCARYPLRWCKESPTHEMVEWLRLSAYRK